MITYKIGDSIGTGSFSEVFQAVCSATNSLVAVKRIRKDPNFAYREVDILQTLHHPNIVRFIDASEDEEYVHIIMELVPESLSQMLKRKFRFSHEHNKIITFQILRALQYIHARSIVFRDLKPHNILIDPKDHRVVLCDFGSAKIIDENSKPSVAYICSRYYRAPELLIGSRNYGAEIDMWSFGVVFGELLAGGPIFPAQSTIDQFALIMQWLGTPSYADMNSMNPDYEQIKLPQVPPQSIRKLVHNKGNSEEWGFMEKFLHYNPSRRPTASQGLGDQFFADLDEVCISLGREAPKCVTSLVRPIVN